MIFLARFGINKQERAYYNIIRVVRTPQTERKNILTRAQKKTTKQTKPNAGLKFVTYKRFLF